MSFLKGYLDELCAAHAWGWWSWVRLRRPGIDLGPAGVGCMVDMVAPGQGFL